MKNGVPENEDVQNNGGVSAENRHISVEGELVPVFTGEFWTSRQRRSNSIHEISYRACYKAELPAYFIKKFAGNGTRLFDPFLGRGTTLIEGALHGISGTGMDVNPLSEILTAPRLEIPGIREIEEKLRNIDLQGHGRTEDPDLSMFFHQDTEGEINALREYLHARRENETEDRADRWIRMIATNRLTGHSSGFFSVYTLPPNQATSQERQRAINRRLGNVPPYRNVREVILRKSHRLLSQIDPSTMRRMNSAGALSEILTEDSRKAASRLPEGSIDLTVTSPPFLNVVQYSADNWLRCWFNHIDVREVEKSLFVSGSLEEWKSFILDVLKEIYLVTRNGGHVAFEVGDVSLKKLRVNLDEIVAELGFKAGFTLDSIMINAQKFTKTSHIWGIKNQKLGTNTNRIVLMSRSG